MVASYFNLLVTLEASRAQLRPVRLPAGESAVVAWLNRRRQPEHHAADAACEEFALKETWPPIQHEGVTVQVHLRLLGAAELCRALAQKPLPRGLTRRQALRAMLLDYWHSRVARWNGDGSSLPSNGALAGGDPIDLWSGRPGAGSNLTLSE